MKVEITIEGGSFELHPSGAMYWKERDMLLISDVHLGKISHFRKHGIALPTIALVENFNRLEHVANQFQAASICFLGDLFHSEYNREWEFFGEWIFGRSENMILITGNHDVLSSRRYAEAGISPLPELESNGLLFTHQPESRPGYFNICGHIHPGIMLTGPGRQRIGLPCFFMERNRLIMPAFGSFTGKAILELVPGSRVFALAGGEIVEIPAKNS